MNISLPQLGVQNPLGESIDTLQGKIFFSCSACMSVWADALSWANAHPDRVTTDPSEAQNIIILSCQVTDLAVLADLMTLGKYYREFAFKQPLTLCISGCLAARQDVELPIWAKRIAMPRTDYQHITNRRLVHFEKPFWVDDYQENGEWHENGHLFRNQYPLRIGKGCPNDCSYCTIKKTRGRFSCLNDMARLEKEFLSFDDVLLVADNPMPSQIKEWYRLAIKHDKQLSLRNVEPRTVMQCKNELIRLSEVKLLRRFHSPIQSMNELILTDMCRDVLATKESVKVAATLKNNGTFIATNVIIDYKHYYQDTTIIHRLYDYVSWNPFWDGKWNLKNAQNRYQHYFNQPFMDWSRHLPWLPKEANTPTN